MDSVSIETGAAETVSLLQRINHIIRFNRQEVSRGGIEMEADIELALLSPSDNAPQSAQDTLATGINHPVPGPIKLENDSVLADISALGDDFDDEIAFTTSELTDQAPSTTEFGFYIKAMPVQYRGLAWNTLLSEGVEAAYAGHHYAALPLFFAGFDNIIERLAARGMAKKGIPENEIEEQLDNNDHWKDMVKQNLERAIDIRFPALDGLLWNEFEDLRSSMRNPVVHPNRQSLVEADDEDAFDWFDTIMRSVDAIYSEYKDVHYLT